MYKGGCAIFKGRVRHLKGKGRARRSRAGQCRCAQESAILPSKRLWPSIRLGPGPALFQPHGKVRARPGPSGEALCLAAPCKQHVVNDATRSLRV